MRRIFTFFIIILFSPMFSWSQSAELLFGTNHTAEISTLGEVDEYHFYAESGDVIHLRMRDEYKVDSYLRLYGPDGEQLTFSWSDGGQARIKDFPLPVSGKYTIRAYDRNHNDVGNYGISLHRQNEIDNAQFISNFTSLEDSIKSIVGVETYYFKADKDDVLFAQMRAQTVHTECEFFIYNSAGEEVFKSKNTGRLATVGPIAVPSSDTYKVMITDRGGNDLDKFGFTYNLLNHHEGAELLECGGDKQYNINKLTERKIYRLIVDRNQLPIVEVRASNHKVEGRLEIYDSNGNLVDEIGKSNAVMSKMLPLDYYNQRSYLLVTYDNNGNDFGDMGMQVQFLDFNHCEEPLSCENDYAEIDLDGLAQSKIYRVKGVKGQPISVTLEETSNDTEPQLRMYDYYGNMVASDKDIKKADLSDQNYPKSDHYFILAGDRSGNDMGKLVLNYASSNFEVNLVSCQTVYPGFQSMASATLNPEVPWGYYSYKWSNGETTKSIHVCPETTTDYTVTVTDGTGCSVVRTSTVEVIDVSCKNNKVTICHVNSNTGKKTEKCIHKNGVWGHLNNGWGHEHCYIGPCEQVSICGDSGNSSLQPGQVSDRDNAEEIVTVAMEVYPNPAVDVLNINMENLDSEYKNLNISILDIQGKVVYRNTVEGNKAQVSTKEAGIAPGTYFVKANKGNITKVKSIIVIR